MTEMKEYALADVGVCTICGERTRFAGVSSFYDDQSQFETRLFFCPSCNSYQRELLDRQRLGHYKAATYVQLENESRMRGGRRGFFEVVLDIADSYVSAGRDHVLVDVGSAYGHLLEEASARGYEAIGVELNHSLRDYCGSKGLSIVSSLSEVPKHADVVTMIDSLYCFPDPVATMGEIREMMNDESVIVMRVTNRNSYVRVAKALAFRQPLNLLGDALVSYSLKSLKRLLNNTGFELVQVIPDYGQGKKQEWKRWILYRLGLILSVGTFMRTILTPGIIAVARRTNRDRDRSERG